MEKSSPVNFNDKYRERTKWFAINLCRVFDKPQLKESTRVVVRQILRSGTGMAANFRAATRACSTAEYYSKICIVVEECDETLFWLEILEGANLIECEELSILHAEIIELLRILSSTKKKLKLKRFPEQ